MNEQKLDELYEYALEQKEMQVKALKSDKELTSADRLFIDGFSHGFSVGLSLMTTYIRSQLMKEK